MDEGLPKTIATRYPPSSHPLPTDLCSVWTKKTLWMVRMHSDDIKRIHIADLRTKYGNQGLDIIGKTGTPHVAHLTTPIEMRAIYACLPMDFDNDGDGKKVRRLFLCL